MKNIKGIVLHLASIPGIQVLAFLIIFISLYFGTAFIVSTILPIFGVVMFPFDCGLMTGLFSAFISASLMMIATIVVGTLKVVSKQPKTPISVFLTAFGLVIFFAAPIFGAVVSIIWGWRVGMDTYLLVGLGGLFFALFSGMSIPKN